MDQARELFERAKALHQKRQLGEAIELYQRAVGENPQYAEAYNNLGNALASAGRLDEAAASLNRAAELRPDLGAIHNNLGLALMRLQRLEEAEKSLRRAVELQPGLAAFHTNVAMTLRRRNKWREAVHHLRRAAALDGNAPEPHLNLGTLLMELDQPKEAVESFRLAVKVAPDLARAHLELADALHNAGQFEAAQKSYSRAAELDNGLAQVHTNRGRALLELGRTSEAVASLDRAIAADPFAGRPYFYRLRAMGGRPGEGDVARLESILAEPAKLSKLERPLFHATLAIAYESLGRFDEAFAQASSANRLRRAQVDYDEAAFARRLDRVREVFTRDLLSSKGGGGSQSDLPIFVIGLPRSGSTLIEQILASHPQVQGGGERPHLEGLLRSVVLPGGPAAVFPDFIPQLLPGDFRLLGDTYVQRLAEGLPAAHRLVDKYLANYIYAGLIHLILPKARIVHATRDPLDLCLSAYFLSFTGNAQPQSYDLGELGRHYRLYASLMDHWRRVLPAGTVLDVSYESLVNNFEAEVWRLLDFVGLSRDPRCLSFHKTERPVHTASLVQVRQELYTSSVGRWRQYEAHLGPLIEALGDYAIRSKPQH